MHMTVNGVGTVLAVSSGQVPWDELRPRIAQLRENGEPWTVIADSINATYHVALSAQAVRYRFAQPPQRRSLLDDPVFDPGYRLPPARAAGKEPTTQAMVVSALQQCARESALGEGEALSMGRYAQWRETKRPPQRPNRDKPEVPRRYPSLPVISRVFTGDGQDGSWMVACQAAGLVAHEPTRSYAGLARPDVLVHLAHWLRWLARNDRGAVATAARYRQWAVTNPQAPSPERLRAFGPWVALVADAAALEQRGRPLPDARPVGRSGRRESGLRIVALDVP